VLYGLVADPVTHPGVLARASRVLVSSPGGPALGEARRRLKEGQPLIVGLSRADTEAVQGRLVDAGVIARIGPAPEGSPPLSRPPGSLLRRREVAVAGLLLVGALAWLILGPAGHRPANPGPRPPAFALSVFLLASDDGQLYLQGTAQARTTGTAPKGDLELVVRTERDGGRILTAQVPEAQAKSWAQGSAVTRSVAFRLPVSRWRFAGQRDVAVEGRWGAWRSEPQAVRVP
jgi:hypothetical protein